MQHDHTRDADGLSDLLAAMEAFGRAQRELGTHLARSVDLPRASISILRYLHRTGAVQIGCIAQHLRVDLSVASRQISTLVAADLVRRTVDDGDRRARTIELTDHGHDTVATIRTHITEIMNTVFADWEPDRLRAGAEQVSTIAETVAAYAPPEQGSPPARQSPNDQNPQQPEDTA